MKNGCETFKNVSNTQQIVAINPAYIVQNN